MTPSRTQIGCLLLVNVVAYWAGFGFAQEPAATRVAPQPVTELAANMDQPAPQLLATDLDGRAFNLRQYAAGSPVVVALTSTTCPLCRKYGPTLAGLEQKFRDQGVKFVYVVSIATDALNDARRLREELGWTGPVLLDRNQELVQALQAETTTEAFLYDQELTLRYRGAVDDQYGLGYTKPSSRAGQKSWLDQSTASRCSTPRGGRTAGLPVCCCNACSNSGKLYSP